MRGTAALAWNVSVSQEIAVMLTHSTAKQGPSRAKQSESVQRHRHASTQQLLQRKFGNQALHRLLTEHSTVSRTGSGMQRQERSAGGPDQGKLRVGAVNDPLEHEADRLAEQV